MKTELQWNLKAAPGGKKWHRDDWKPELLTGDHRPLFYGESYQADDELLIDGDQEGCWRYAKNVFIGHPSDWPKAIGGVFSRTTRPLPPFTKTVAMGPEDVPPGSVLKYPEDGAGWSAITSVSLRAITFVRNTEQPTTQHTTTYEYMKDSKALINRNDGKGFVPCSKEVPA